MKNFYKNHEIAFAVICIVIYCFVSIPIRGSYGDESPLMLGALAAIAGFLTLIVKTLHLETKYGLDHWPSDWKPFLFFIPMWILATGNLWGGIKPAYSGIYQLCAVLSMALIGYIEELIFRGFLFKALIPKDGIKMAIIISAVTFGIGHILNLFAGQTNLESVLQVVFAIAWGFLFTFVFYKSGSLLPGILAHSLVDVFSKFAAAESGGISDWIYIGATILISLCYCLYLSKLNTPKISE